MCLSETLRPLLRRFEAISLTLKDDLDLTLLKMCSTMRYTCMPNIKLLSSILQMLLQMLKFDANKHTNTQTNGQGKNNMSPTIVVGDIKIHESHKTIKINTFSVKTIKGIPHNIILLITFISK
jgi:hypothetical protein